MNIKHLGAAALASALLASGAFAQEAPAATDTTTSMAADPAAPAPTDATSATGATTTAAPPVTDATAMPPMTETPPVADVEEDRDFPWGLLGLLGLAGLLGLKKRDDDVRVRTTTTG